MAVTWHSRKAAQLLRRAARQPLPNELRRYTYQAARLADEVESDGVSNALATEALDLAAAVRLRGATALASDFEVAAGLLLD